MINYETMSDGVVRDVARALMNDHYDRAWDEGYAQALSEVLAMVEQVDDRHKNCAHMNKIQKNIRTKLDKLHQETMFPAT